MDCAWLLTILGKKVKKVMPMDRTLVYVFSLEQTKRIRKNIRTERKKEEIVAKFSGR